MYFRVAIEGWVGNPSKMQKAKYVKCNNGKTGKTHKEKCNENVKAKCRIQLQTG